MFPSISIIVPVYKAEAYLRRCVDSLLVQTFTDFEVLLIDDGSPDRSGEICDAYAKKDTRVRVFHQPNGGVSVARQRGLDEARGEYTIHADPDDWVEPNMLEELYRKAKEDDADMVICDFYTNDEKTQKYVKQRPSKLDHCTVSHELFQQLHGSCWNKLVKRVCYGKYGIHFPKELSFCEDLYTNAKLLHYPLKIAYVPRAFYHYDQFVNKGSIVHTYSFEDFEYDKNLCVIFERTFNGTDIENEVRNNGLRLLLTRAFEGDIFSSREFRQHFYEYRWKVFDCISSRRIALFYYMACIGFYKSAKITMNFLLNLRDIIRHP